MAKVALIPPLLFVGCLIAGLYGALHDQISYSVGPDYFHAFKFHQFGIPGPLRGRVGAALVGWHGTWWMGLIIGVPVLLVGLRLPGPESYLRETLVAFAVVALTALVFGLGALAYASLTIARTNLPAYRYPVGVADKVSFARVATMHGFGYLGGLVGILTASAYLALRSARLSSSGSRNQTLLSK